MTPQNIKPEQGPLLITLFDPKGSPIAWEIPGKQLLAQAVVIVLSIFGLLLGTLFFFRELEINRQLTERLLWLETEGKRPLVFSRHSNSPVLFPNPIRETAVDETASKEGTSVPTPSKTTSVPPFSARISNVTPQCAADSCMVELTLVPSATQTAQGSLLMVLETEVPRIGTSTAGTQSHHRFFIYPGMSTREELRPSDISQLPRKSFRFQRLLETRTHFALGKLLRPLALNVYLFDYSGTLSFHERYPIESD